MILEVVVPGEIVPTARVRIQHGAAQTPRRTVEYKARIARAARSEMHASAWPERYQGRVKVLVTACMPSLRLDLDNVLKGALDALVLAKVLFTDRCSTVVAAAIVADFDAQAPRLLIEVHPC